MDMYGYGYRIWIDKIGAILAWPIPLHLGHIHSDALKSISSRIATVGGESPVGATSGLGSAIFFGNFSANFRQVLRL